MPLPCLPPLLLLSQQSEPPTNSLFTSSTFSGCLWEIFHIQNRKHLITHLAYIPIHLEVENLGPKKEKRMMML
jgi:hypothetical protein